MTTLLSRALLCALAVAGLYATEAAAQEKGPVYAVTITNLTRGQVITPALIAAHTEDFSLFEVGQPASPALATLAEEGNVMPLANQLSTNLAVQNIAAGTGPLLPGQSATIRIAASGNARYLSAVAMLAVTNDAFFAIRGLRLPDAAKPITVEAAAYDAGSEANSESCTYVPGPPCGAGGVHDPAVAEGFVHVHAGIHGVADLIPSQHDWRNPVVEITIWRVKE